MQLRELQKTRRAQEKKDADDLVDILEMYKSRGDTYDPSEDGFVFSEGEMDDAIRARNPETLAEEAYEHRCDEDAD